MSNPPIEEKSGKANIIKARELIQSAYGIRDDVKTHAVNALTFQLQMGDLIGQANEHQLDGTKIEFAINGMWTIGPFRPPQNGANRGDDGRNN
jgi:hypothetical protein